MEIIDYDKSFYNDIGCISAECFLDSPFYSSYKEQGEIGKRELSNLYAKSMELCSEIGTAKCAVHNNRISGFIMGFDYHRIKNSYPDKFKFFFVDGNIDEQNNLLSEDLLQLDNAAKTYLKCAYLMTVAVGKKNQRLGIATELVKSFLNTYPDHAIITDVVSTEMESLCRKMGFHKIDDTMPNCSVYLKQN